MVDIMIDITKPIRVKNKYNLSVSIDIATPGYVSCHITDGVTTTRLWFEQDSGKCEDSFINLEIENVPELSVDDKIEKATEAAWENCKLGATPESLCRELINELKRRDLIKYD